MRLASFHISAFLQKLSVQRNVPGNIPGLWDQEVGRESEFVFQRWPQLWDLEVPQKSYHKGVAVMLFFIIPLRVPDILAFCDR